MSKFQDGYREKRKNEKLEVYLPELEKQEESRQSLPVFYPDAGDGAIPQEEDKVPLQKQKDAPLLIRKAEEKRGFWSFIKRRFTREKTAEELRREQEKAEQKKRREEEKAEKKRILKYEDDKKNYDRYGVGFSLDRVDINAADRHDMRAVKQCLKRYLELRENLIKNKGIVFHTAEEYINEVNRKKENSRLKMIVNQEGMVVHDNKISMGDKLELSDAYEKLKCKIKDYLAGNDRFFMNKRQSARVKQVHLIRQRLHMDNMEHSISKARLARNDNLDIKYTEEGNCFFTWQKAFGNQDRIEWVNLAYRERRERQRKNDNLPGLWKRWKEWWSATGTNTRLRLGILIFFPFGMVDRVLGLGTMVAANALTLGGKIIKTPLKILSLGLNGVGKLFGRKKNIWNVKYHPTKGWKDLNEGRQIFRDCANGLFSVPTAVYESVVRGFPYLFNKIRGEKTEKVFKNTAKLSFGLRGRIKEIFRGLGYEDKNYELAEEEMRMIEKEMNGDDPELKEDPDDILDNDNDEDDED